jgi:hypothetical protein
MIENINFFLGGCQTLGVSRNDLFTPTDLVDETNIEKVFDCILVLKRILLTPRRRHTVTEAPRWLPAGIAIHRQSQAPLTPPSPSANRTTPLSHLKERAMTPRSQEAATKESPKERPSSSNSNKETSSNSTPENIPKEKPSILGEEKRASLTHSGSAPTVNKRASEIRDSNSGSSSDSEAHTDKSALDINETRDARLRVQRRSLSTSGERNLPNFRSRKLSTAS